ncbi:putative 40S ribosomal protein S11-like [Capsicum annuum]|nr:putative 40S ribosomal protein S11-like [Capsicum annuum]KAF3684158.1 putative 40S ribosomal protein S11-like [Capsicum annuum]
MCFQYFGDRLIEYVVYSTFVEQEKTCFICEKGGYRADVCLEISHGGSKSSKICLKYGNSSHDMSSCKNDYAADDLKMHVQHIVGTLAVLGHLIPIIDVMKKVILHANALILAKLISGIMNHQPKKKVQKKRKEQKEFISKPHDFGRAWKKKGKNEGGYKSGCKVKQNGGWISDDPEDYPQLINWRSPSTPRNKRAKISNFSTGGNSSVPRSSRMSNRLDFDNSSSYGL